MSMDADLFGIGDVVPGGFPDAPGGTPGWTPQGSGLSSVGSAEIRGMQRRLDALRSDGAAAMEESAGAPRAPPGTEPWLRRGRRLARGNRRMPGRRDNMWVDVAGGLGVSEQEMIDYIDEDPELVAHANAAEAHYLSLGFDRDAARAAAMAEVEQYIGQVRAGFEGARVPSATLPPPLAAVGDVAEGLADAGGEVAQGAADVVEGALDGAAGLVEALANAVGGGGDPPRPRRPVPQPRGFPDFGELWRRFQTGRADYKWDRGELGRAREKFVAHYTAKYPDPVKRQKAMRADMLKTAKHRVRKVANYKPDKNDFAGLDTRRAVGVKSVSAMRGGKKKAPARKKVSTTRGGRTVTFANGRTVTFKSGGKKKKAGGKKKGGGKRKISRNLQRMRAIQRKRSPAAKRQDGKKAAKKVSRAQWIKRKGSGVDARSGVSKGQ